MILVEDLCELALIQIKLCKQWKKINDCLTKRGFANNQKDNTSLVFLLNYASLSHYHKPDRQMFWKWYEGLRSHATSRFQGGYQI